MGESSRRHQTLASSALAVLGGLAAHWFLSRLWPFLDDVPLFLAGIAVCFAFQFLAWKGITTNRIDGRALLLAALLIRALWISVPPALSEDVFRYLWDGTLSYHGVNPYLLPPQDLPEFQARFPELYGQMAHLTRTSIYPPAAQFLFLLVTAVAGPSTIAWRLLLLIFEGLLVWIWKREKIPLGHQCLWLLNPLVIVEFYSSGHLDLLAVVFLMAAFSVAGSRGRWGTLGSSALLAAGSLVKIFPAFALPLILKRQGSWAGAGRYLVSYTMWLLLAGAAFSTVWGSPYKSLQSFTGILGTYRDIWRFNSIPFLLLQEHREGLLLAAEALFFLALALIVLRLPMKDSRDLAAGYYLLMMVLYVCAHTVHPWYVSWGLAAVPMLEGRFRAGLYLSGAVFVSYLAYGFEPFQEKPWILWLEWTPFYALVLLELRRAFLHSAPTRPGPSPVVRPE